MTATDSLQISTPEASPVASPAATPDNVDAPAGAEATAAAEGKPPRGRSRRGGGARNEPRGAPRQGSEAHREPRQGSEAQREPRQGRRPAPSAASAPGAHRGAPAAGRKPSPVLERLFELYPAMFGARFLPLKLGVYQELLAAHGDEFKKDDLKLAMGQHARSTRYLEAVAAGEQRHDLQGVPVEPVSPEHVHHAILEVYRRRQARGREDAAAWLHARLVNAVQASGLTREAWDERTGATDDFSVQALDAAYAELASRAARREALKRAYEASGRSVAEFAEMYGMEPSVVQEALGACADVAADAAAAPAAAPESGPNASTPVSDLPQG